MNVKRLGALLVAALLVTAAVPAFAASDATVGDFVIKLAKSRNLAATDARVAADSLRGVGVRIPVETELSARLTERHVADLSRVLGLNLTTTNPDKDFSTAQVDQFFATFGGDIGYKLGAAGDSTRGPATGLAFNPYTKGKGGDKGKKKGHDFTPTEPE